MTSQPPAPKPRKDLWIPAIFIGFFVFLAGVEAWFVTIAHTTFSGVVTDNAYSIGLAYDDVLAQREAERRLGWSSSLQFDRGDGLSGRLTLVARDALGQPLAGLAVHATAERMTRFPQVLPVAFSEISPGRYAAPLAVPLAGRWFIRTKLEKDGAATLSINEVDIDP
ncbi:FixH family protein [Aminobacter sp. AP02]|uniref:FixH family protein n=1 Tax=Aminobacter sp. AP02 TaxID=2135737 RepID=UPI000D6BF6BB|nr:FixH family protein [Aminobacter sp. AP02]PWK74055.1 nitrogen fixation protein FixH [Aminobacter sp. AP02]